MPLRMELIAKYTQILKISQNLSFTKATIRQNIVASKPQEQAYKPSYCLRIYQNKSSQMSNSGSLRIGLSILIFTTSMKCCRVFQARDGDKCLWNKSKLNFLSISKKMILSIPIDQITLFLKIWSTTISSAVNTGKKRLKAVGIISSTSKKALFRSWIYRTKALQPLRIW